LRLRAPAKLNLCLYLGPRRADDRHEIRSLFCPLTLADRIVVADADADQVVTWRRRRWRRFAPVAGAARR
jgi:4-diphosphocytidyl-2C-methyl-D-erythritol kinase